MRQLFTPKDIRSWSLEKLRELIGVYCVIETPRTPDEMERSHYDESPWGHMAGVIQNVGRHDGIDFLDIDVEDGAVTFVEFDWGTGFAWMTKTAEVYISACDGDNDHGLAHDPFMNKKVVKCLRTLRVGMSPLEARGKYGDA